jgi:hypothetical protein
MNASPNSRLVTLTTVTITLVFAPVTDEGLELPLLTAL